MKCKTSQNWPKNANDHEQQARVHPAQPSYSVVVPAPELLSINVAVGDKIGTIEAFRKGDAFRHGDPRLLRHFSHHRPPAGRRSRLRRRFNHLNRFLRFAYLSDRSIRDRDHQHHGCDNRTQHAGY